MSIQGQNRRIMAIDYGRKRVGIAVSDSDGIIAQPLCTLRVQSQKKLFTAIRTITKEKNIGLIIIGDPRALDGTITSMSHEVRRFSVKLQKSLDIKIILWDERFTSKYTRAVLKDHGLKQPKTDFDKVVASIMLSEYLRQRQETTG
jgi:putative Holliday junction resolvase